MDAYQHRGAEGYTLTAFDQLGPVGVFTYQRKANGINERQIVERPMPQELAGLPPSLRRAWTQKVLGQRPVIEMITDSLFAHRTQRDARCREQQEEITT